MSIYKYSIAAGIAAVISVFNLVFFRSTILGVFGLAVYIIALSLRAGHDGRDWPEKFSLGLPIILAGLIIPGSLIYFFYEINQFVVSVILLAGPIAVNFFPAWPEPKPESPINNSRLSWLWLGFFLIFIGLIWFQIIQGQTDAVLRSPFEVVSKTFFVYYFLTAVSLIKLLNTPNSSVGRVSAILFFFTSLIIGIQIYQIGFGFDPFIHQATEKVIAENGFILPKQLYYLGQYFLITFVHLITLLPIDKIDAYLVPTLSALILPSILIRFLTKHGLNAGWSLLFLIIPFSQLTITTPQSLAYILLYVTIFSSSALTQLLLAIAALTIHPIAGIPAIGWTGLTYLDNRLEGRRKPLLAIYVLLFSIILPMMFIAGSLFNNQASIFFNFENAAGRLSQTFNWTNKQFYSWFLDLGTTLNHYTPVILIILAGLGSWISLRTVKYWLFFVGLMFSYLLIVLFIDFPFLISYEQSDYANRIKQISFYFLLPAAMLAWHHLDQKISPRFVMPIVLGGLLTGSMYFSYPRHNQYAPGHMISIGSRDIKAVKTIEEKSSGEYIVLANQSVSTAALKELGFKKYFKTKEGPVYFYPIPTGGPLYRFYLKMVYDRPSRATVKEAAELAGVREAYFVINSYWSGYQGTVETAKAESQNWWSIDKEVTVFQYLF